MKKLLIVLTVSLFLVSTAFISVSAKTIDPAQDHIKEIETLGYNLSELPTEEEVLENGDVKIWHCIYPEKFEYYKELAIDPIYNVAYPIDFYDVDHLRYDPRTGEVVLACLPEMNPAYLIDGLRYYSIGIPGGVIAIADYPGDINGDNVLDMKDVLQFRQYLIGYDVAVRNVMNLNVDDAIDMKDLLVLRQLIISAAN